MTKRWLVDPASTDLRLRTRAKGLFSALAHDLEIGTADLRGEATREDDAWRASLVVPVSGLHVVGVIRGGRVDANVLSASDRAEIERKMRQEVFAAGGEIVVEASGSPDRPTVRVTFAGRVAEASVRTGAREDGSRLQVGARGTISMRALGLAEVKAPLGAFSVKDEIEVEGVVGLNEAWRSRGAA